MNSDYALFMCLFLVGPCLLGLGVGLIIRGLV